MRKEIGSRRWWRLSWRRIGSCPESRDRRPTRQPRGFLPLHPRAIGWSESYAWVSSTLDRLRNSRPLYSFTLVPTWSDSPKPWIIFQRSTTASPTLYEIIPEPKTQSRSSIPCNFKSRRIFIAPSRLDAQDRDLRRPSEK